MLGYFSDHAMVITSGVFLFLVVLWALVSWLNHHWIGPSRAKADKRMPIFSTIAQIRCASMMSSLAAFTSSGVSFSESMQRMAVSSDDYMRWQIKNIEAAVRIGKRPEQALSGVSMMHPSYQWILAVYGLLSSTSAAAAYEKIAEVIDEKDHIQMELFLAGCYLRSCLASLPQGYSGYILPCSPLRNLADDYGWIIGAATSLGSLLHSCSGDGGGL